MWVRLVPPKTRGKDIQPRKRGYQHGNWKHGFGKTRDWDTTKYSAWKEAVLRNGYFCCFVTGQTTNLTCHHLNSWNWCKEGRYDPLNEMVLFFLRKFIKSFIPFIKKVITIVLNLNIFYVHTIILLYLINNKAIMSQALLL